MRNPCGACRNKKQKSPLLRLASLLFVLLLSLSLVGCSGRFTKATSYGMGSYAVFTVEKEGILPELISLLALCENEISHRREQSAISRLNQGEALVLSEDIAALLSLALEIGEKTNGRFSVLSLKETALWDFDASSPTPPTAESVAEAVLETEKAELREENGTWLLTGGGIDLGAVGKGYATDLLARSLKQSGQSGLIAVGGSIAAVGRKTGGFKIGVRDPFSTSREDILGVLTIENGFVSTSGSYEKRFTYGGEEYHHILDAKTGLPVENELVSVTVLSQSGALSDMLSTAAFILGLEEGLSLCEEYGALAIFVLQDGSVYASSALRGAFTLTEGEVHYR